MLSAKLRLVSADAKDVISTLEPESHRKLSRTNVIIHGKEGEATIEISATDASAMRAALNSYLECIRITEDISKITGE
ncbi:MAG: KEOPS complex subunit Pcc1 [Candidatus Methanomethylophilaceae archaeon]|nr:KEOPS complex subunit Pcc1 [Candidatus Methanomethylophilaceae archaeon]